MRLIILFAVFCLAAKPSESDEKKVNKAILHICTEGIPKHKIKPWKKHPIVRNHEARERLTIAIIQAAGLYPDVDYYYLVALAYREGSFGYLTKGELGEKSTFQMMRSTAKEVRKYEPYCTLKTVEGSAICAAAFLDRWSQSSRCGNVEGALIQYATGKSCKPYTPRLRWLQWDRAGIAQYLRDKFAE